MIALDVGTSSMRSIIFSDTGEFVDSFAYEYHTFFPKPSYVEQDPLNWKEAATYVLLAAGMFCKGKGIVPEAVSITSQRASVIPMSEDGRPLYNAVMWQDKRTIGVCERLIADYGLETLYQKTGLRVNPLFVLNKLIWFRENEPEIFASAKKFIGVQDYVVYCLTGEYVTDYTQASRTMLMDLKTLKWDPELLAVAGITEEHLCRLLPPGSIAGYVTDGFSKLTGLPKGIPVIVSGGDQQNAALGLGVMEAGKAEANTGTGSFLLSYSQEPAFDKNCRVLCQAGAAAGSYVLETSIYNSGAIFRWFKEEFCPDYNKEDAYVRMSEEAGSVPTGSGGVIMLPHFEGSAAPFWNPKAKGLFFNLGLGSDRRMMIRSIMEGIALEISENLGLMRALIGDINTVTVAGGMNKSRLFCQMQADCYDARVVRPANTEASSLGALMNAGVALGWYADLNMARYALVKEGDSFSADKGHVVVYAELRKKREALYQALYEKGIYDLFMNA